MNQRETLLIELRTEELPPKSLNLLGETFANGIFKALQEENFLSEKSEFRSFATPRRLGVTISHVAFQQPDKQIERKGPSVAAGLDASGKPSQALLGFAKSCNVGIDKLEQALDDKGKSCYVYRYTQPGESLHGVTTEIIRSVLSKLPVAKVMRWGMGATTFVRPVHGLIMMCGDTHLQGHGSGVLGLHQNHGDTLGHRFMGKGKVKISHATKYEELLETEGYVIANFARRREIISVALQEKSGKAIIAQDDALLDEVTALVEYPAVYAGEFSPEFLEVPQECLILSMKQHQKYFPLLDKNGKLLPRFLMVSNIKTDKPENIIHGNERVLRARLADAKFFFEKDRKQPLDFRVLGLSKVVYHNKLGTQGDRVQRVQAIARAIGQQLGGEALATQADQAALLAKADLLTDMVGEFPELQGIMGRYYAQHDGMSDDIAFAIEDHYKPRFAGDELPRNMVGICVALADKLETLVGMFNIGQIPTGDKDPFALRRHALGVTRILVEAELPLDIDWLLKTASKLFGFINIANIEVHLAYNNVVLADFIFERLAYNLREQGYSAQEVEAIVGLRPQRLSNVPKRLAAVRVFVALPEAAALAAANKRVGNILRKAFIEAGEGAVIGKLLQEPAEQALHQALIKIAPKANAAFAAGDYTASLQALAALKEPVDAFFDNVMVNADDAALRANRLALLAQLHQAMNRVADISRLAA